MGPLECMWEVRVGHALANSSCASSASTSASSGAIVVTSASRVFSIVCSRCPRWGHLRAQRSRTGHARLALA